VRNNSASLQGRTPSGLSVRDSAKQSFHFSFACPRPFAALRVEKERTLPLYPLLTALQPHMPEWAAPFVHVRALKFHLWVACAIEDS
ncbi:MAG: hypothetical protein LW841_07880, partial [Flammeovirgaceae bacterium]|nr:hypothetical protein [Flammeovirgaceae bacterium]